jgi:hypothetical protein
MLLNLTSNRFELIIFVLLEYKYQLFLLQLYFSIIHHVINM